MKIQSFFDSNKKALNPFLNPNKKALNPFSNPNKKSLNLFSTPNKKALKLKMKCIQRLCQRNKNLKPSGYCNVCDDVVENVKKQYETKESQRNVRRVELDLNLLVDTHKKLATGKQVGRDVVDILLLGGISNILNQSESVDNLTKKVRDLEIENLTNATRLEALENWATQLHKKQVKDEDEVCKLKQSFVDLENERMNSLGFNEISEPNPNAVATNREKCTKRKSCNECDETFLLTSDREKHMVNVHGAGKVYCCDICKKTFYLEWRLRKHVEGHGGNVKVCRYFKTGQNCPYEEVGCKFQHKKSQTRENENAVKGPESFRKNEGSDNMITDEPNESVELTRGDNCSNEIDEVEMVSVESDYDEKVDVQSCMLLLRGLVRDKEQPHVPHAGEAHGSAAILSQFDPCYSF